MGRTVQQERERERERETPFVTHTNGERASAPSHRSKTVNLKTGPSAGMKLPPRKVYVDPVTGEHNAPPKAAFVPHTSTSKSNPSAGTKNPGAGARMAPHATHKGMGTFIPVLKKKASPAQRTAGQKQRYKKMAKEIRELQKFTGFLIRVAPFTRLLRDTLNDIATERESEPLRMTSGARDCLQYVSEVVLTEMFSRSARNTVHAKRQTLMPSDIDLTVDNNPECMFGSVYNMAKKR